MRGVCRACRLDCICKKICGDSEKCCIELGFAIDMADKYPDYTGGIEEGVDYMKGMDEKRIVHAISTLRVPYVGLLCDCDLKYCTPYEGRRLGVKNSSYKSEFMFKIDADKCDQCGECAKRCLFGTIRVTKEIFIDKEKCFGCRLCRTVCEQKAIAVKEGEGLDIMEKW